MRNGIEGESGLFLELQDRLEEVWCYCSFLIHQLNPQLVFPNMCALGFVIETVDSLGGDSMSVESLLSDV